MTSEGQISGYGGGRVGVLSAGFPCQPFSLAGKRRGADDDRFLWPETIRAIRAIRPAWFVGENVFGLASMVLPGEVSDVAGDPGLFGEGDAYAEVRQRYVLDRICGDIEEAGYSVQPVVIPACAVGAPHRRDRIWLVARRVDADPARDGRGPQEAVRGAAGERRTDHQQPGERRDEAERSDGLAAVPQPPHPDGERLQWRGQDGEGREGGEARPDEPAGHLRGRDASHACGAGLEEALKALGNAWVPEVAYEIFRMIQKVEEEYGEQEMCSD